MRHPSADTSSILLDDDADSLRALPSRATKVSANWDKPRPYIGCESVLH
jgi:hypothetical protein